MSTDDSVFLADLAALIDADEEDGLPLGEALAELGEDRLTRLALACVELLGREAAVSLSAQLLRRLALVEALSAVPISARAEHRRRRGFGA